jgi:hypothetical protein
MRDTLKIIFFLPVCQVLNLVAYANTRETWPRKIGTFVVFVPIILFTTAMWGALWAAAIYLTAKAFSF